MEFKVRIKDSNSEWDETFIKDVPDNNVEEFVIDMLNRFNSTLRAGERIRELVSIEIISNKNLHNWVKRTDGMSVEIDGRRVDLYYCSKCFITATKYSIWGEIERDTQFRAKKYMYCKK